MLGQVIHDPSGVRNSFRPNAPDMVIATWLGLLGVGLGTYIPASNTAIMTAIRPDGRPPPAGW